MKQLMRIIMLAAILIMLLPHAAQAIEAQPAPQAIGEVISMMGSVTAQQPGGTSRDLDLSSPVFARDVLVTGMKSNVEIRFQDETTFAQGPQSTISLDEFVFSTDESASKLLFRMGQGTFRFVSGEIVRQNPEAFNLNTPLTTIGIRGTEPFAVVTAVKETIGVLSIDPGHVVEVTSPRATVSMDRPGLSTDVGPDGSMSTPAPTSPQVQQGVINAAPMTSQGERGARGTKDDLTRKVTAFKQNIAHSKGQLGGLGDKPDYGQLHTLSVQTTSQTSAESDRDGTSGSQGLGGDSGGGDSGDGGSDGGGGGPH